jgi:NitT/TauT family transport system ATP-binding protein
VVAVSESAPLVEIAGIAFAFGATPVLADVSLAIPRGGFVAIVGSSGVGKSTLARIVAGLVPPQRGTIRVESPRDPGRAEAGGRPTAIVFQDARLLPWRRVRHNVELGLEGIVGSRRERHERAAAALAIVGLADQQGKFPHELSGGQRQRVGIARALAVAPDLLIMDEPFSALDAITRRALQDELLEIWQRVRTTILFVTHDLEEAVYLADRVVLLAGRPGRIVEDRIIAIARPRRREAAAFGAIVGDIRRALGESFVEGGGI